MYMCRTTSLWLCNQSYSLSCLSCLCVHRFAPPPPTPLLLQPSKPFSFCGHAWIYDPASKSRILQLENQMQQLEAFEQSMLGVS